MPRKTRTAPDLGQDRRRGAVAVRSGATAGSAAPDGHDVAAAVGRVLGEPVLPDAGWRPPVQGAVGHVVGLRSPVTEQAYVVKVFAPGHGHAADTESTALRLAASELGGTVPAVLGRGDLAGGAAFVVMTRLVGERWSDRRPTLDGEGRHTVVASVARTLAALHRISGRGFGSLVPGSSRMPHAWQRAQHLLRRASGQHARTGGDRAVLEALGRALEMSSAAWPTTMRPALCHHDVNGGNTLVSGGPAPRVTGLVDFERSSWADPLEDLALTGLHLLHEEPEAVPVLLGCYRPLDGADLRRFHLYTAMLAVQERAWVVSDRPRGWDDKAAFLDHVAREQLARVR